MKKVKKAKCALPKYDFSGLVGMSSNMLPGIGQADQIAGLAASKNRDSGSVADNWLNRDPYGKIKDGFKKALPFAGLAGSAIYTAANPSDDYSDEKSSALGMGLQGAAMGSQFGGIYGAIGGGLLGAGAGWLGAKKRNIEREERDNNLYNAYILNSTIDPAKMEEGGPIHIKEENKGKFTKYANSKGMSVQEAAHWVMAHSKDPDLRKRAQFAINATKFNHPHKMEEGGEVEKGGSDFEETGSYMSMPVMDKNNVIIPQMYGSVGDKGIPITHIQTEDGEKIIYPDGSIFDTKAKVTHEKMSKDEVTDILPQGAYVAGARDKQIIKKKDAEKISLGNAAMMYNEFDNSPNTLAEEVKMSDLFKREEHTPSELADIIKKKFKMSKKESDAFTDITNAENKIGRMPYLMNLISMVESKKEKKQRTPDQIMKKGRVVKKYDSSGWVDVLNRYLTPEVIDRIKSGDSSNPSVDPTINRAGQTGLNIPNGGIKTIYPFDDASPSNQYSVDLPVGPTSSQSQAPSNTPTDNPLDSIYKQYGEDSKKFADKYQQKYADYFKYARGANAAANGIGILGTVGQSSYVNPGLLSSRYADQMFQKVPNFVREANKTESLAPLYSIARNQGALALPTSTTMSRLSPMVSNAVNTINQTNKQFALDDVAKDNAKYKFRQDIENRNLEKLANAENRTTGLDNYKLSQTTGFMGRALTGDASLRGKEIGTMYGIEKGGLDTPLDLATKLVSLKMQDNYINELKKTGEKKNAYVSPELTTTGSGKSDVGGTGTTSNTQQQTTDGLSYRKPPLGTDSPNSYYLSLNDVPSYQMYKSGYSPEGSLIQKIVPDQKDLNLLGDIKANPNKYSPESIKSVQKMLNDTYGYPVKVDGKYGPQTKKYLTQILNLISKQ